MGKTSLPKATIKPDRSTLPKHLIDKLWRFLNSDNRREKLLNKLQQSLRVSKIKSSVQERLGLLNNGLPQSHLDLLNDLNKHRR